MLLQFFFLHTSYFKHHYFYFNLHLNKTMQLVTSDNIDDFTVIIFEFFVKITKGKDKVAKRLMKKVMRTGLVLPITRRITKST